MNTVGKKGRLGEEIRCVVSVSMHASAQIVRVLAAALQNFAAKPLDLAQKRCVVDLSDVASSSGNGGI
jgi:hypothetical protein